jgi:DNA-binding transcriptional MerR regulator
MGLQISDLAHAADVPVSTIRYYERIGLLTAAQRSAARYRLYNQEAVDEVRFIRRAQGLGFTLPEIAGLLNLSRSGKTPCEEVLRLGRLHLAALDLKLEQLTRFRSRLNDAVSLWSEGCCGFTARGLCSLVDLSDLHQGDDKSEHAAPNRALGK